MTTFEFRCLPEHKIENRNSVLKKLLVAHEVQRRLESEVSEDTVSVNLMGANFVTESFYYDSINKSASINKNIRDSDLRKTLGKKPVTIKIENKELLNKKGSEAGSLITIHDQMKNMTMCSPSKLK